MYAETTSELVARGLSVYSFDWRGQGGSSRPLLDSRKSHVDHFDDYLDDLERFVHLVWQPQSPCYLITHSMGGHLALRFLAERAFNVDGALLCAPMVDIKTRRWQRKIASLMVDGMLALGLAGTSIPGSRSYEPEYRQFNNNPLTSDPERFARLPRLAREKPELTVGGPTFGWVGAAFESMDLLGKPGSVESVDSPITLLVGDADIIIDLEAARNLSRRIGTCRLEIVEGARHEIMQESDPIRSVFWRFVDGMLGDS